MDESSNLLTLDNCKAIVSKHLNSQDFTIKKYEIKPLQSSCEGLIGEQYTVSISFEHDGKSEILKAFLKILNGSSQVMFELSKEIKAYEKEDFFYNTIVPEFTRCGIDMSFAPKCYLCFPYTVVLEDLAVGGYKGTNKQKPLSLEYCKKSIEILSRLHASGIIYEKQRSAELGKPYNLLEDYSDLLADKLFTKQDNPATRWLKCSLEGICELIDLLPENGVTASDFKQALMQVHDSLSTQISSDLKCSILHGDLWSNNFLFKCDVNSLTDAKLIDYQTVKYGPIALDIEQFIMTNTRKSFRDSHEAALLDHYYETFVKITKQQGFVPDEFLSREDLITACKVMRIPAKIQAIVDRSITFMSDEIFGEVIKDEEVFKRFLFSDRGKYIVESYKGNKDFRDLISEDMLELRELLFS